MKTRAEGQQTKQLQEKVTTTEVVQKIQEKTKVKPEVIHSVRAQKLDRNSSDESDEEKKARIVQKPAMAQAKISTVTYEKTSLGMPVAQVSYGAPKKAVNANKANILMGFTNEEDLADDVTNNRNIDMNELQALLSL